MTNRRSLLIGAAAGGVLAVTAPARGGASPLETALLESDLVYLSPLKSDGSESRCHAEVWFVADDGDVFVVTAHDAWRARAVRAGLDRARLWFGEFGAWRDADGAFRSAPGFEALARIETDQAVHARILERFGDKYTIEWVLYGPRFRNGLADGSRVMLRYRAAS